MVSCGKAGTASLEIEDPNGKSYASWSKLKLHLNYGVTVAHPDNTMQMSCHQLHGIEAVTFAVGTAQWLRDIKLSISQAGRIEPRPCLEKLTLKRCFCKVCESRTSRHGQANY